jgi:uncharacterized protein YceH (UPF0502 family)
LAVDAVELRVLGCLVEKQQTTPDQYPLSLNALRLACNQATNRDPVVEYDEETIRDGLTRLSRRDWVRLASGRGSRAVKYRHLLDEALSLSADELSLLAVLMLRGPQTAGELRINSDRLHKFGDILAVEGFLNEMAERPAGALVRELSRAPGARETRWAHLLSGEPVIPVASAAVPSAGTAANVSMSELATMNARIEALESTVARLCKELGITP